MKIKSFVVIPLAIFSLNICAVEERVHDFSVIENFAIAFKNDLLAHSVSKYQTTLDVEMKNLHVQMIFTKASRQYAMTSRNLF